MSSISSLPIFKALDDPNFGADFEWSKEFFENSPSGLMQTSWGELVAFSYKDILALSVHPMVSHQGYETQMAAFPPAVIDGSTGLSSVLKAGTFHLQPPQHLPNKNLAMRGLTAKAISHSVADFGETVASLIAKYKDGRTIDFIHDFAEQLLIAYWGKNLGLSEDEVRLILNLSTDFIHAFALRPTEDELLASNRASEIWLLNMPQWLERAEKSGLFPMMRGFTDSYLEIDEDLRSPDRYALMGFTLLDGFHTLGSSFAATVFSMIKGEFQPCEYSDNPDLLANGIVSEAFRIHGPVALTTRQAIEDIQYENLLIPAGSNIYMMWSLANLDPQIFPDPFHYMLARPNAARKLSFGGGPYMCAGRHLAKSLSECLVKEFIKSNVRVEAAGDCKWRAGYTIRELIEFPVKLG